MAQTNNLWSNFLLAATRQPRKLAGLLGIADPESYLTAEELRKNEQAKNWGIQAIADVTDPFARGANILAQGYGDLYRGLSGNTDYVSPLESYIKSGISQESHQRIQDNPYKEILKSGAGMAATLAPMSTGGVFTNAATKGTRAFSGLNPSANPLVNQLAQIVARGGLEGGLGGFGHSREGKELTDTLTGAGLGVLGEGVGEYVFNKSFRDLLNENVSRAYKMAQTPGTPMRYSDLLNGDITVSANNQYSNLFDQVKEGTEDIDVLRDNAMNTLKLKPLDEARLDSYYASNNATNNSYLNDIELFQRSSYKSPEMRDYMLALSNQGLVDDGYLRPMLLADYGIDLNKPGSYSQMLGDPSAVMTDPSKMDVEIIGGDTLDNIPEPTTNMDDQMKQLADRYKSEGIPGVKDGTVRQPDFDLTKSYDKHYLEQKFGEDGLAEILEKGTYKGRDANRYLNGRKIINAGGEAVLDNLNPTGNVLVDYDPQSRMKMKLGENITTLDKTMGKRPSDTITIYRGAPKNQKSINPGDFITTSYEIAKSYTGDGNVLSKVVKLSDILDDITEPLGEEYLFRPKSR